MAPKTKEKIPEVFALSPEERKQLVDDLVTHTAKLDAVFRQDKKYGDKFEPHIHLIGMMGYVNDPELDGRQINHVHKMIALDYLAPKKPMKGRISKKTRDFLVQVEEEADVEIALLRDTKDPPEGLPRSYEDANQDLSRLRDELREPMIRSLALSAIVLSKRQ